MNGDRCSDNDRKSDPTRADRPARGGAGSALLLDQPLTMDIKDLKLELLERIALIDDETRLMAVKRLLDAPRGYGIPNEQMSVVREGEAVYGRVSVDELVKIIRGI